MKISETNMIGRQKSKVLKEGNEAERNIAINYFSQDRDKFDGPVDASPFSIGG